MPQTRAINHQRHLACLVVLLTALFVCPASVAAIPLSDYEQKIKDAITALDTLSQVDEEETESEFQARLLHTIDAIRVALPEHMTVETNGDTCFVDNSSLHKSLAELKELGVKEQFEKIPQIIEVLRALEARVSERRVASQVLDSKEQAKSKLESILARPEYATGARSPNALTRLIQDFLRWLQNLFPRQRTMEPGRIDLIGLIVRVVVIVLAVAVLAYVAISLLKRFGRTRITRPRKKREPRIVLGERLEPEATSTDLLSQAEALARHGDLRAAIRKAYIALLVELGDRKMIRLAQHKTNRDYLNSIKSIPPLHATMRGLTDSFERHWYGSEQATPDDWQDFRAGYLAALRAES